jgi:hypothetical protein
MDNGGVLYVGAFPYPDGHDIAAEYGLEPDTAAGADLNIAGQGGIFCYKNPFGNLWGYAFK